MDPIGLCQPVGAYEMKCLTQYKFILSQLTLFALNDFNCLISAFGVKSSAV
jgi:hypothetical protein